MIVHDLKCWPEFFKAVWYGTKRFELRKNDRNFDVSDQLNLREWDPVKEKYTGRSLITKITYIFESEILPKPYVILSLSETISKTEVL